MRIEVEIEVEAIRGFAAGQLDLGLATRSHVSMAIEEELKADPIG